jgi:hypothetical protein
MYNSKDETMYSKSIDMPAPSSYDFRQKQFWQFFVNPLLENFRN